MHPVAALLSLTSRYARSSRLPRGACRQRPRFTAGPSVPRLVAILGPTRGQDALGIALAGRFGGEIAVATPRGLPRLDIGTDKVPAATARHPHHMVDVASRSRITPRAIALKRRRRPRHHLAGRLPIWWAHRLYYRRWSAAVSRAQPRCPAARASRGSSDTRGVERLHRWLRRVDPSSADRVQSRI